MLKKFTNKKGFTLMEMLIVVAIIAILVAIAIPTFSGSLDKANAATDLANIRSGYASAQIKAMTETITDGTEFYLQKDGSVETTDTSAYVCKGKSTDVSGTDEIGGKKFSLTWGKDNKIVYTITGGQVSKITNKAK